MTSVISYYCNSYRKKINQSIKISQLILAISPPLLLSLQKSSMTILIHHSAGSHGSRHTSLPYRYIPCEAASNVIATVLPFLTPYIYTNSQIKRACTRIYISGVQPLGAAFYDASVFRERSHATYYTRDFTASRKLHQQQQQQQRGLPRNWVRDKILYFNRHENASARKLRRSVNSAAIFAGNYFHEEKLTFLLWGFVNN